ncbi:uncharacterized protein LOC126842455 [Adelges cooleyi]|uniref:uncharacterized protein LOC126842452 n=1 Tax=Adelges cooleyi TaxID=133065 RepID=UPI00217F3151|nr:uncharacterized protein LOC126842452 [Adelges cooleyi]XP_050435431.1 uncharacterized protein LOC126842455 [Adelges cooleyi]
MFRSRSSSIIDIISLLTPVFPASLEAIKRVRIQNRRVKWRKESKLQNDQNTLQYHHLETIASQSSTGHQAHVESNNFRESLYETHLNETSYGTMNLRPDLEEQEEQTNKSVYLKNFYEPKYDVYPIYVRKKVLITELIVRHHS